MTFPDRHTRSRHRAQLEYFDKRFHTLSAGLILEPMPGEIAEILVTLVAIAKEQLDFLDKSALERDWDDAIKQDEGRDLLEDAIRARLNVTSAHDQERWQDAIGRLTLWLGERGFTLSEKLAFSHRAEAETLAEFQAEAEFQDAYRDKFIDNIIAACRHDEQEEEYKEAVHDAQQGLEAFGWPDAYLDALELATIAYGRTGGWVAHNRQRTWSVGRSRE